MNIKITSALTLGIVVLAGGALFFWPDLDDEPQASAQEVVENACVKSSASTYFDIAISGVNKSPDGQDVISGEVKISVAGTDFHYAEYEDESDELGLEVILLDGVAYSRHEGVPWLVSKDLDGGFVARDSLVAFTEQGWTLCPDFPDIVEKVGQRIWTALRDALPRPMKSTFPSTRRSTPSRWCGNTGWTRLDSSFRPGRR